MSKKKALVKKIFSIAGNVLLYFFLILCIFSVVVTVVSKRDADGTPELFGYQFRVVTSDSMAKCESTDVSAYKIKSIPIRSLLFIDLVPDDERAAEEWYDSVKVGDVLTFRYVYTSQVTITHRVVSITEKADGGYLIDLAGDNVSSETYAMKQTIDTSEKNSYNYVIGRVTGQSYPLGLFLSLLKSPAGIILAIILPCFLIILFEVLRIVKMLSAAKQKRIREEAEEKENELEELRRKLKELEEQTAEHKTAPPTENAAPTEGEPTTPPTEKTENTDNV